MIGKRGLELCALCAILLLMIISSCSLEKEKVKEQLIEVPVPDFNSDSAYFFVEQQVKFGPRIPNSPAHRDAGDYLVNQFKMYGASVTEQEFVATTFDNQKLKLRNIIASFYPAVSKNFVGCPLGHPPLRG